MGTAPPLFPHPSARPSPGFGPGDSLAGLNRRMDGLNVPYGINESRIESLLDALESAGSPRRPAYWLLLARVTELALLVAGHYADHGEFSAAGDLLVNPRAVCVRVNGGRPAVKDRHCRLSDQFRPPWMSHGDFVRDFKAKGRLETVRPALLPELTQRLVDCGRFTDAVLEDIRSRSQRVADTLGFLCAGGVASGMALHGAMAHASAAERAFWESGLCRFGRENYDGLGRAVERSLRGEPLTDGLSRFCLERDGRVDAENGGRSNGYCQTELSSV